MGEVVGYKVREGVGLVTVENPPINALSHAVRVGLLDAVNAAIADPEVKAIVIQAAGRTFPAGADLRDFRARIEPPALGEVCRVIEDSPKPMIAAIHGTALGGGLELALACHFRMVQVDAQLGMPDVALGSVPAAGASQRLPRLVGAERALDMLISARPISAEGAMRIGLVDKVVKKNLGRAAFGSARNLAGAEIAPRPTRARTEGMRDPKAYLDAIEEKRAEVAEDRREAVHKAVELVEAALLLPFDAGLDMERVSFEDLVESDQARGLRHAFLAERRATRAPALAPERARGLERVGVVGTGRQAVELVRALLAARLRVTLHAEYPAALAEARARIETGLAREVADGRLGAAKRDARLAWLATTADPHALDGCDMVIEAEDAASLDAVRTIFAELGATTRAGAILASATAQSAAGLEARALASGRPADVLGLRFSEPVHISRLVEILRQPGGADDLGATGVALARRMGKTAVVPARPGPGLAAPVLAALWRAAEWLVEEGTSPVAVDAALRHYGLAEGPFEMLDRIGLDRTGVSEGGFGPLIARMLAQGWVGVAAGRGFRAYGDAADPEGLAPGVADLIDTLRADLAIELRVVGDDEIVGRCLGAMVNAGAGLVAQRTAARPSDIDAAMVQGYGFPRWRGGPMEAADLGGLLQMRNRLRDWAAGRDGALWQPQPLFDELIKNGRGFESLSG